MPVEKLVSRNFAVEGAHRIDIYQQGGGYAGVRKALTEMKPEAIVEEVKKSNLRGLGGAGFPAGMKWSFVPRNTDQPKYLVVNADEGEPGTFKDRYILERNPHLLLEGIIIACYALGVHRAYIYIRGEYVRPLRILQGAVQEAYSHGFLGKDIAGSGFELEVIIHSGAGAYICGEETALLESLEGKRGWPRLKPPFPAIKGLFQCPTVVNNVETLCHIPHIILRGGEWFAALGVPRSGGVRLFSVSGHVNRPGVYELPLGIPLRAIIYDHAGGILGNRALKAVIPGGSSAPVLAAHEIDVPMDFDSLAKVGSMAGSGAIIVMHDESCMVEALLILTRFYAHESCGQCTPCREGTGWMSKILQRIAFGQGRAGDLEQLLSIAGNILGNTICPLGDAAALPVQSFIRKFRDEFEYHIRERQCHLGPETTLLPAPLVA